MRRLAPLLCLLLCLTAKAQPSYWFQGFQRQGNAQLAQQYFFMAGPGITITYTNPYVYINATGTNSGGGGGGLTNIVLTGDTIGSGGATITTTTTNVTAMLSGQGKFLALNATGLVWSNLPPVSFSQTNIYATNLIGFLAGNNVTFTTNGSGFLIINSAVTTGFLTNFSSYNWTNHATIVADSIESDVGHAYTWSIAAANLNLDSGVLGAFDVVFPSGGLQTGMQMGGHGTAIYTWTLDPSGSCEKFTEQFQPTSGAYPGITYYGKSCPNPGSMVLGTSVGLTIDEPHHNLIAGSGMRYWGDGFGITNAQFSSHIFTNSVVLSGIISNLNFIAGANVVLGVSNVNGQANIAIDVPGGAAGAFVQKSGDYMTGALTNQSTITIQGSGTTATLNFQIPDTLHPPLYIGSAIEFSTNGFEFHPPSSFDDVIYHLDQFGVPDAGFRFGGIEFGNGLELNSVVVTNWGLTTNIPVLFAGGVTNILNFTNGLLMAINGSAPPVHGASLLLETGGYILLENGGTILLE